MEAQRTSGLSLYTVKAALLHDTKTAKSCAFIMSKKNIRWTISAYFQFAWSQLLQENYKYIKSYGCRTQVKTGIITCFLLKRIWTRGPLFCSWLCCRTAVSLSASLRAVILVPLADVIKRMVRAQDHLLVFERLVAKPMATFSARYSAHADILCFRNFKEHLNEVWIFP